MVTSSFKQLVFPLETCLEWWSTGVMEKSKKGNNPDIVEWLIS
jgi:hypothetical protein